jgi:hypothetical protein
MSAGWPTLSPFWILSTKTEDASLLRFCKGGDFCCGPRELLVASCTCPWYAPTENRGGCGSLICASFHNLITGKVGQLASRCDGRLILRNFSRVIAFLFLLEVFLQERARRSRLLYL